MSSDRLTEILNILSAISRDIGAFRVEMNAFRAEVNARLDRIERELRQHAQRLDRIEGMVLTSRADVGELQDRVVALESK